MDTMPCPICSECQWDVDDCIAVSESLSPMRGDMRTVNKKEYTEMKYRLDMLEGIIGDMGVSADEMIEMREEA